MAGIGVIYNPRSGKNVRDPAAAMRLARTLGDHGVVRRASSLDELYRAAEDFQRLQIDVLGISGGDGTNGTAITGFLDVYQGNALPQIAFLRGGTMNTVANAVGVRRDRPERMLDRLCQAYVQRAARPLENVERHVMCLRGEKTKYGFNFGTGVVVGYLSEYYAYGEPPSPATAAKTLLRAAASTVVRGDMIKRMAEPFRGRVTLDDGTTWEERDYLAIAGGTVDQIGLNFRPFYRYDERPDTFHLLGIHTSPLGFVRQLPRIHRAAPMAPGHAYDAITTRATVESAKGRMRYMIDGDLYEVDGPLHVTTGPRVRIVIGT